MKKNVWFLTGTDTNVGKTLVGSYILKIGLSNGYNTIGYKPVASSSKNQVNNQNNVTDIDILKQHSNVQVSNENICPFFFEKNGPPHMLSDIYNKPIVLEVMSNKLRLLKKMSNWIVIEGAGGWYTPLTKNETFVDWVKKEKLSVILVVGIKLGCINHAILTQKSIINNNINYVGWIANHIKPYNQFSKMYVKTLQRHLKRSCLIEIPYFSSQKSISNFFNEKNKINNFIK